MAKQRIQEVIAEYLIGNVDRIITLNELSEATGFNRNQCANGVCALAQKFPQLERPGSGLYRWNSNLDDIPTKPPTDVLVSVLDHNEHGMLVRDNENGMMYVMRPFKWE